MLSDAAITDLARSGLTPDDVQAIPHKLGYVLPYYTPDGSLIVDPATSSPYVRIKLTSPKPDGPRYLSPRGSRPHLYFPPTQDDASQDPGTPLVVVEGEKKAAAVNAALQAIGFPAFVVGVGGITMFTPAVELPSLPLAHRTVYILLDSDTQYRSPLRRALRRIINHCLSNGARPYECMLPIPVPGQDIPAAITAWERHLRALPEAPHAEHIHPIQLVHEYDVRERLGHSLKDVSPDERLKVGADDFLVAGGDLELLLATARGYTYLIPESRRAALDVAAGCWCTVNTGGKLMVYPVLRDGTLDRARAVPTSQAFSEFGCQKVMSLRVNRKGEVEPCSVPHYRWWTEHRDSSHTIYTQDFVPAPAARHGTINTWRGLGIQPIGEMTAEDMARPFIKAHPALFDTYGYPQVFPTAPRLVQFLTNHVAHTIVRRPDYARRVFGASSGAVRTSSVPAQTRWFVDLMIHSWLHPDHPVPIFLTFHGINGLGKTLTATGLLGAPLMDEAVLVTAPDLEAHAQWENLSGRQLVVRDEADRSFDREFYSRLKARTTSPHVEVHAKYREARRERRYFYEVFIFNGDDAVRNVVSANDHRRRSFCFNDAYYSIYNQDARAAVDAILGIDLTPEAVAFRHAVVGLLMTWGEEDWKPIVRDRGVMTLMDQSLSANVADDQPPVLQVIKEMVLMDDNTSWLDTSLRGGAASLGGEPGSMWDDQSAFVQGLWRKRVMAAADRFKIKLRGVPNTYSNGHGFVNYVNGLCLPGHAVFVRPATSKGKQVMAGTWRMVSKDQVMEAIGWGPAPISHYDVNWGQPGEEGFMEE